MPNSCKFRIYQGPQNGAQFELSKGEYVLGSGDEADLIFSDEKMAPMHASLNIDDNCNVTVIPKDGDCYFNDELIAEPALLTSEIFCKLGATVLALKGDGKWPDYDAYIEQKLQSLKADLKQNEKADAGIHSEDKNEASANENISYERKSFFISKSWRSAQCGMRGAFIVWHTHCFRKSSLVPKLDCPGHTFKLSRGYSSPFRLVGSHRTTERPGRMSFLTWASVCEVFCHHEAW